MMAENGQYQANLYTQYDKIKLAAAQGEEWAKEKVGTIELVYAAMNLGGKKLVDILKSKIGVIE